MYALAAAIVVGALFVGASLESLVRLALVAACPLMMFFMMRSMHGQDMHGGHDQHRADRDEDPLHKHDHHTGPGGGPDRPARQGMSAMAAVIALLAGVLMLAGFVYDTTRRSWSRPGSPPRPSGVRYTRHAMPAVRPGSANKSRPSAMELGEPAKPSASASRVSEITRVVNAAPSRPMLTSTRRSNSAAGPVCGQPGTTGSPMFTGSVSRFR